jgi:hypothetical protein
MHRNAKIRRKDTRNFVRGVGVGSIMTGTPMARKAGKPSDSTPDPDRRVRSLPKAAAAPPCGAIGLSACAALFLAGAMLAGAFSPGALAGPGGIGSAAAVGAPGAGLIRVSSGFEVVDASGPAGTPLPLKIALPENAAET